MFGKKKKEITSVKSKVEDVVVDQPKESKVEAPSPVEPQEVSLEELVAKNTDAWFKGEQLGYLYELRNGLMNLQKQNEQLSTQLAEIVKLLKEAIKE